MARPARKSAAHGEALEALAGEAALLVTSCQLVAVGGPGEAVLVNVVGTGECRPAQAPGTYRYICTLAADRLGRRARHHGGQLSLGSRRRDRLPELVPRMLRRGCLPVMEDAPPALRYCPPLRSWLGRIAALILDSASGDQVMLQPAPDRLLEQSQQLLIVYLPRLVDLVEVAGKLDVVAVVADVSPQSEASLPVRLRRPQSCPLR